MEFYELIKTMSLEELENCIKRIICVSEMISKDHNKVDYIGYNLDYNPTYYPFLDKEENSVGIDLRCFYNGYIPKNTKMVYKVKIESNMVSSNDGSYYYIDDDSYILEFCKYIKDIEVENEFNLFFLILNFLNKYFGNFNNVDRDTMFKMILKNESTYYDPINEHSIKKFKNSGNAMCSEYAVFAQNILSIFGFDSSIIIGQTIKNDEEECHAFNLVSYVEKDTGKEVFQLVDFSFSTGVLNVNFKKVIDAPYIIDLDDFDEEKIEDFMANEYKIEYMDYIYMLMNDDLMRLATGDIRQYYISNELHTKNGEINKKLCYNLIRK